VTAGAGVWRSCRRPVIPRWMTSSRSSSRSISRYLPRGARPLRWRASRLDRRCELGRRVGAAVDDRPALSGGELAADRLDLGKLGHVGSARLHPGGPAPAVPVAQLGGVTRRIGVPASLVGGGLLDGGRRWWRPVAVGEAGGAPRCPGCPPSVPLVPWEWAGLRPRAVPGARAGSDDAAGAARVQVPSQGGSPSSSRRVLIRSDSGGWVLNRPFSFACSWPSSGRVGTRSRGGRWRATRDAPPRCCRPASRAPAQAGRVAGELDGGGVGERLALAADRRPDEPGGDGGEDDHRDDADQRDRVAAPELLLRPRPPPNHRRRQNRSQMMAMAPAVATAMVVTRMS
jgi:hypothetical protein